MIRGNSLSSMAPPRASMVSGIGAIAGTEGSPPCLHYSFEPRLSTCVLCRPLSISQPLNTLLGTSISRGRVG